MITFLRANRRHLPLLLVSILTFTIGWQLGRASSPYYQAHPIIFKDRECSACQSSGGSAEELSQLKDQGIQQRQQQEAWEVAASNTAVAGIQDQNSASVQQKGAYVGSKNSDLYHHPTCSSAKRIKPANQVWFKNAQDAQQQGYMPSKCTEEKNK